MKKLQSLFLGASVLFSSMTVMAEQMPMAMVYKSPSCGCCNEWIKHLEENGINVMEHDVADVSQYKVKGKVPNGMGSCHTAFIGDYVIEGHVPAEDVIKLLTEKPEGVLGLTVPGMPMGSPGMEYGDQKDPYKVISFSKDGKMSVFSSHN